MKIFRNYLKNPRLKAAGVKINFTLDQAAEWIKCQQDPIYFAEKYMKIVHKDRGLITIELYEWQKEFITSFLKNRFNIVKCSRQIGKSVAYSVFVLHQVIFNDEYVVGILANKATIARKLLATIKKAYENLPLWLQQGVVEWNKESIELENGSKIIVASTSPSAFRSESLNCLILDEFAWVPRNISEEFYGSAYPVITSGTTTKIIIVSTPNGMNMYYDFWTQAKQGTNGYVPLEAYWYQVPGRGEEWKQAQLKNMSAEKWEQEFECNFLSTSQQILISPGKLKSISLDKPISSQAGLDVYELPKIDPLDKQGVKFRHHTYTVCVDPAEGTNNDYSAFTVVDVTELPYRLVAKYRSNKVSPMVLPTIVRNVAQKYHDAYVLVETNSVGMDVINSLYYDLEYENIFSTAKDKNFQSQKLSGGFKQNSKLGLKMTHGVKKIGCSNLKSLIENDQLLFHDAHIVQELSTFVQTGNSWAAEVGTHDDLVMSLVLFGWLINQRYFKEIVDLSVGLKITEMSEEMQENTPMKFFSNTADDEEDWKGLF